MKMETVKLTLYLFYSIDKKNLHMVYLLGNNIYCENWYINIDFNLSKINSG